MILRFGRLRRAQGRVAFTPPETSELSMASTGSRRLGNGGGVGGAFQPYLDSLRQELQQRDPTVLSVVVALLAVLLTLGKEAVGGYGGCGAGESGLNWKDAGRRRHPAGVWRGNLTPYDTLSSFLKQREQRCDPLNDILVLGAQITLPSAPV